MKFFLDSADLAEIEALHEIGVVDGITTNPTIIAKSGKPFVKTLEEIAKIVKGPISAEVVATEAQDMEREGRELRKIAPQIVVKLPCIPEGFKACTRLTGEQHPVNMTLCFSTLQALMAAKCGATFISPFIGRLDDISQSGIDLIAEIADIYANYPEYDTQILAASIRHPLHIHQAALAGADAATVPPKILRQAFDHPLTDKGLKMFLDDWAKTGQKIA